MTVEDTTREFSMDTTDCIAMKPEEVEKDGGEPAVAVRDLHKSFDAPERAYC